MRPLRAVQFAPPRQPGSPAHCVGAWVLAVAYIIAGMYAVCKPPRFCALHRRFPRVCLTFTAFDTRPYPVSSTQVLQAYAAPQGWPAFHDHSTKLAEGRPWDPLVDLRQTFTIREATEFVGECALSRRPRAWVWVQNTRAPVQTRRGGLRFTLAWLAWAQTSMATAWSTLLRRVTSLRGTRRQTLTLECAGTRTPAPRPTQRLQPSRMPPSGTDAQSAPLLLAFGGLLRS